MEVKRDFSDVVNEYSNDIYRFVLSKVRHRETAEDITQDVFMRALQGWTKYTEMDKLKAWLFKIAHNCVLRQYEYARRTNAIYSASNYDEAGSSIAIDFPDSSSDPENDFLSKEAVDVIIRLVNLLPPEHRVVIKCRYIDDMSLSETAQYTGLPVGTVKSRTHYAIEQIRKNLGINDISEISEKNSIIKRRKNIMTCNDAKAYFYIYAIGDLNPEIKNEVDTHLKECDECCELIDTMKELVSKMVFPEDGVFYDYHINISEHNLKYYSLNPKFFYSLDENGEVSGKGWQSFNVSNKRLRENTNKLMGTDGKSYPYKFNDYISRYDGKPHESFVVEYHAGMENEKILHIVNSILLQDDYGGVYQPDNNPDPECFYSNCNRNAVQGKSVSYAALPTNAYDVNVIRGSGIITAGKYRFVYSERYTEKDEFFGMRYSFKLK